MQIPGSLQRILAARGITGAAQDSYLASTDWSAIERPEKLDGIAAVVTCLMDAVNTQLPIGIFADYDCDGVLSGAILYTTLKMLGANVSIVLPTRDQGYGITSAAVERFAGEGKRLIVTVDNGIVAHEPIALANRLGIDVIVIDHHHRCGESPRAAAILWDDRYCAAALAFMVSWALLIGVRGEEAAERTAKSLVRLAAIAMIADCVPLTGSSRSLTKVGLQSLSEARHPGLRRLLQVSGVTPGIPPSSRQVAWSISPILNSPGRLGNPADALDALLESNPNLAVEKVNSLKAMNDQRREKQNALCAQMFKVTKCVGSVCVAYDPKWPRGLVGIMASRAVEHFGVPAFVLGLDPVTGLAFGSARSIPGFNLVEAMDSCRGLLTRYGGHTAAAGITIAPDQIGAFREAVCDYANKRNLEPFRFQPEAELTLSDVGGEFFKTLKLMEPFGTANEYPRFVVKSASLRRHKSYASLMFDGKREIEVRHPDDAQIVYGKVPHNWLVEATPTHIYLRGGA